MHEPPDRLRALTTELPGPVSGILTGQRASLQGWVQGPRRSPNTSGGRSMSGVGHWTRVLPRWYDRDMTQDTPRHQWTEPEIRPRHPSERGWAAVIRRAVSPGIGRLTADLVSSIELNRSLDKAIEQTRQNRAADRTFENETRLH